MKKGNSNEPTLQRMVDGYNEIYENPLKHAYGTYKKQLGGIGRADERNTKRSTLDKTNEKWPLDHIPG